MSVQTEIRAISPAEAEALLTTNLANRKPRSNVVDRYVSDMRSGAWTLNGESIKVAQDGTLLDGQHRLMACVEAGTTFRTIFVTGLPTVSRDTIDTGAKRAFADVLRWRGEKDVATLAAAVQSGLLWDNQGTIANNSRRQYSNTDRLVWLEANPDIRDGISMARPFRTSPWRLPVSAGVPFAMRVNRMSPEDARVFFNLLQTGANLSERDPIARLRSWLFNVAAQRGSRDRWEYAAICVKSWNAWIEGREIRQLVWKRGGALREDFPTLLGPDGRTYEEIVSHPAFVIPTAPVASE